MLSVVAAVALSLLGGTMALSAQSEARAEEAQSNLLHNVQFDTERDVTGIHWADWTWMSNQFENSYNGDCLYNDFSQAADLFERAGFDGATGVAGLEAYMADHPVTQLCAINGTMYAIGAEIGDQLYIATLHPDDEYNGYEEYQTIAYQIDGSDIKYIEALDRVVVRVAYGDAGVFWSSYYALDGDTWATDQVEFCTGHTDDTDTIMTLSCEREYVPTE